MAEMGKDGVIAVAAASPGRRLAACTVIYLLGILLIYLAFAEPPALPLLILIVAFGGAVLLLGDTLRRATRTQLVLRPEGLFDDAGTMLAEMDEIVSIDRGTPPKLGSGGVVALWALFRGRRRCFSGSGQVHGRTDCTLAGATRDQLIFSTRRRQHPHLRAARNTAVGRNAWM